MNIIEQVLDEASVDWSVHEPSGLHLVSSSDFTPTLLTDISSKCCKPMKSLNYGNFVAIVPKDKVQVAIDIMNNFGFDLKSNKEQIVDMPRKSKYDIDSIVEEVGEELNTQELFKQFGKAMKVLGEQMGTGPIQDMLKKRGINWRLSDDKNALIFFLTKGSQEQRIAQVSAESIGSQNEFQEQLLNMMDFATGEAPGTFKQKQEQLQNQQQLVRDVSKAVWPEDTSSKVASLMNEE